MKPQNLAKPLNNARRIEPLAVLPIFLDLHGKSAFVIGASEGALWKAELLLQAGAHVTLICERPTQEALQLATGANALRLEFYSWRDIAFDNVAIVIADVPQCEIAELAAKARAAGALFNAVDRPEFCQFQFGSIVNKSPLVIGISTGGAAPVLAQLVRALIEAILPDRIQKVARVAQRIRGRINRRLSTAMARREYWNEFFSRALGAGQTRPRGDSPYLIAVDTVDDLSLRDLQMLRQAESVYFELGAEVAIANFARREARRYWHCKPEDVVNCRGDTVLVRPLASSAEGRALALVD